MIFEETIVICTRSTDPETEIEYVPIKNLTAKHYVLTQDGTLHKVTKIKKMGTKPFYRVLAGDRAILCAETTKYFIQNLPNPSDALPTEDDFEFLSCSEFNCEKYDVWCKCFSTMDKPVCGSTFDLNPPMQAVLIDAVEVLRGVGTMYDIEIDGADNFFADGLCVKSEI